MEHSKVKSLSHDPAMDANDSVPSYASSSSDVHQRDGSIRPYAGGEDSDSNNESFK